MCLKAQDPSCSSCWRGTVTMQVLSWITNLLCPPTKNASYKQAEGCFTREELDAIRHEHCVHVISQYIQTVDDDHFLQWAGLDHATYAIRQGLCNAVRRFSGPGAAAITLDGVIIAKARCEKMDRITAEDFAFDVLDIDGQGHVSRDHLQAVVEGCIQLALHLEASGKAAVDCSQAAAAIAAGSCSYSGEGAISLNREGYTKLCKVSPALNTALLSLLSTLGKSTPSSSQSKPSQPPLNPRPSAKPTHPSTAAAASPSGSSAALLPQHLAAAGSSSHSSGGPGPGSQAAAAAGVADRGPGRVLLPQLGWGLCRPDEGLLQTGWVWLLSAGLAPSLRQEWRLLFNSAKHGMSFSTFTGRLGDAAPTLLLIRDKGGAVFGGIAHQPWKKTGTFYGDYASCVFSLLPAARIYPASGINPNIQWCGVGFSQLPNGVGFGGQVGHFGVWLDATLDHGMSRPAATYASPCLASSPTFQVDVVEAWLLQPPEEELSQASSNTATPKGSKSSLSALDKAKEDRKILEWAGLGSDYSAAVREEPLEED